MESIVLNTMSQQIRKAKRNIATIHAPSGPRRNSRSAGIYSLTPMKTRRGKMTYKEVCNWSYYRASSSEGEETPRKKKTKTPGGATGEGNIANEFAQSIDEDYTGGFQGVTSVRRKTKVKVVLFQPIFSNPIKDSE